MKNQSFDSFLQDVHAKGYNGTDDDMPDAYESWLMGLDVQEIMDFAEEYGVEIYKKGFIDGGITTANEANGLAANPN